MRVRFRIWQLGALVAIAAAILWLHRYPATACFALGLGGLVLAMSVWAGNIKRAPSTALLCALIGAFLGFLLMPVRINDRPTNDLRDYLDLLWLIGGVAAGALVGMVIEWLDRRITRVFHDDRVQGR